MSPLKTGIERGQVGLNGLRPTCPNKMSPLKTGIESRKCLMQQSPG